MNGQWFDDDAGPMVRLFALTRGRGRAAGAAFDLIAQIVAEPYGGEPGVFGVAPGLAPEHAALLRLCREHPLSVAEIASESDLPVGVVRVLLGDLLDAGLIRVRRPIPVSQLPDERLLREVINGLRAL